MVSWTSWSAETRGQDLFADWSDPARRVMTEAMKRAKARGSLGIALPDLALAAASANSVRERHLQAGVDPDRVAAALNTLHPAAIAPRTLAVDARQAVAAARTEADDLGSRTVEPLHLWLAFLGQDMVRAALADHGLEADDVRRALLEPPADG